MSLMRMWYLERPAGGVTAPGSRGICGNLVPFIHGSSAGSTHIIRPSVGGPSRPTRRMFSSVELPTAVYINSTWPSAHAARLETLTVGREQLRSKVRLPRFGHVGQNHAQ
ncbi:hypothetical protein AcV5_003116 [Taiwanofungus camphoratus]|nr:hypothetical protein AcV5_003116 [Antrodia cinnamomea]